MTLLMFPDNTVLINFAIINRMDLLEMLANGKGRWCASVASECAKSAGYPGQATLAEAPAIFGHPIYPDQAELQDALVLRDSLAGPGDKRSQHFGEAETIAVIVRRQLPCIFVTDDRDAARLASQNRIRVVSTWSLLKLAHKFKMIDENTLWGYIGTLHDHDRGTPPEVHSHSRPSFDKWLAAP